MTALALLLCVPIAMWVGQSAMLAGHGLPIRFRLDPHDAPAIVRVGCRLITQAALVAVLLLYPRLIDRPIIDYYADLLPLGDRPLQFIHGAAAATLMLALLFAAWTATDRLRVEVRHRPARLARKLLPVPISALLGAGVEELLFRGVVLNDLLRTIWLPTWSAILIGACLFAAAHYVRRVKRYWTFPGHVALGVLLCVAFVQTRTLWLPAGLHAAGIFVIMGARPLVRFRGPAWLTGASIFPFAGVVGMIALALLTAFVGGYYGPR